MWHHNNRVEVLHLMSTLFVISARLSQRAAALGTWAPHPAAARPTQTSLTSNPELLCASGSSKQLAWLFVLGRQRHVLLALNKSRVHKQCRFIWWKLQTHHSNCSVVVLHPSAYFSREERGSLWLHCHRCMDGPAGLISVDASTLKWDHVSYVDKGCFFAHLH